MLNENNYQRINFALNDVIKVLSIKMSKIYTIAFRMGVLFNVLLWTILNVVSLFISRNKFAQERLEPPFFGHFGYHWGVPFQMFRNEGALEPLAMVINIGIYVFGAFFFGFLFKFVWSKISQRDVGLK